MKINIGLIIMVVLITDLIVYFEHRDASGWTYLEYLLTDTIAVIVYIIAVEWLFNIIYV